MATMADMQRQMAAMQTPVQPTTASEPTVPTLGVVDPAAADYTADERAQLGDLLPGAIDRRAQLAAQQMGNRALEMMQDSLDQRLQGMQTTLDQITQAQQQLTSQTKSQFEAGARASALRNGLDPQTANQDPVWNALMAEPANQITGETFNQHVAAIMARESSVELDRVFEIYAQRKAAANQGQPSVAPIPQGGGAHLGAPAPQGSEDIEGQIIELLQQKKALQQSRFSTDISAVSYNNQAAALQQQIQELQTRLYQPAAG
jgi:flagellar biosynthesis chaperone FliJ